MRTDFTMTRELVEMESILTSAQVHIVKGYGLKADLELLGNRISIMLNNISARKYPIGLVPRFIWVFSRSETAHGSALMLCKSLQSRAVFLHLNVDLVESYRGDLSVKRFLSSSCT